MSLGKRFYLRCDALNLLIDRDFASGKTSEQVEANQPERRQLRAGCILLGSGHWTAKEARAEGKKAGWVRHREPDRHGGSTAFDLCPVCAPKLVQS
ncbi:MAG TPA: hypothetical protein VIP77_12075 [Jiangellaceae bacterium]